MNNGIKVKSYGDDGRGVMKGTEQLSIVPKIYVFIRCGFRGVQGVHLNPLPPFDSKSFSRESLEKFYKSGIPYLP